MPIPFFAHQVAVLPLKLVRPRWFDGVGLVVSSIVPDLAYALIPDVRVVSHSALGLVTWCIPMGVSITLLVRYGLCETLARAGLAKLRPLPRKNLEPLKLFGSVLLGAASHILWDGIVHPDPTYRERWSLFTSLPTWPHTISNFLGIPLGIYLFVRWWRSLPVAIMTTPDLELRARLGRATVASALLAAWSYRTLQNTEGTFFDFNSAVMRAAAIVGTCLLLVSLPSAFGADGDAERLS